jgi:DNA polymerase-4
LLLSGGRRQERDLLARLRETYPDQDWSGTTLARIPVDFCPLLAG